MVHYDWKNLLLDERVVKMARKKSEASEFGGDDGVIQGRRSPGFMGVFGKRVLPGQNTGNPLLGELGHALTPAEEAMVVRRTMKQEAHGVGTDPTGRGLSEEFVAYTEEESEQDYRLENGRDNNQKTAPVPHSRDPRGRGGLAGEGLEG